MKRHSIDHQPYTVEPGRAVTLSEFATTAGEQFADKSDAKKALALDASDLADAQRRLWASQQRSVLIILQGMDAAGKDGLIRHVMSGINPQGCDVHSFKAPNAEELLHHFLWRAVRHLPGKGQIGIYNRSYYEEVLVVRVHPHFLEPQRLPPPPPGHDVWSLRYKQINGFEQMLVDNGTCIIKFFLHLSRKEQKKRFLRRIDRPKKHWKFNAADIRERQFWDQYQQAYQQMLSATSTSDAPWYVLPADDKWFTRALAADIIASRIQQLGVDFPTTDSAARAELLNARKQLQAEAD